MASAQFEASRRTSTILCMDSLVLDKYTASPHRLFLLDYDGTLADYKPTPAEAKPTTEVRDLLKELGDNPDNTVVVISGRDHETLDAWLGDLPLAFAAEHGFFLKEKGGTWQMSSMTVPNWKETIQPIMEAAVTELPGALIEEKVSSLVWHYRRADEHAAKTVATQLQMQLKPHMESLDLILVPGNKVVEVKVANVDKGVAADFWLDQNEWDFILAAGDDTTDEDLFLAMPEYAFTVKIGPGGSIAKYNLPNPAAFIKLLGTLTE